MVERNEKRIVGDEDWRIVGIGIRYGSGGFEIRPHSEMEGYGICGGL